MGLKNGIHNMEYKKKGEPTLFAVPVVVHPLQTLVALAQLEVDNTAAEHIIPVGMREMLQCCNAAMLQR